MCVDAESQNGFGFILRDEGKVCFLDADEGNS